MQNEWAVAIGQNNPNDPYEVTNPKEVSPTYVEPPLDQLTTTPIATAHSHSNDPANPSAGDLYSLLQRMVDSNGSIKFSFIFGLSGTAHETYALVIDDKAAAEAFLATYPKSQNYDPLTHGFLKNSDLWREVDKMKMIYNNKTTTIDTSGENYDPKVVGLAYMLGKLDAGVSIAKVDSNGDLKKINAITENIPNDERAKVSKCTN